MRQQLREWQEATVDALKTWDEIARAPGELTETEQVQRYINFHRGSPRALVEFARREAPSGADALAEAQRYEQRMESLLKRRGNG